MSDSAYLLAALGLSVVLTASFLIAGLWVGYSLGKGAKDEVSRTSSPDLDRLLNELAYCEKLGDRVAWQLQQLSRLTTARSSLLPRDMAVSLQDLQETTRNLSQRLQKAGQGARRPGAGEPAGAKQIPSPLAGAPSPMSNHSDLSAQELGQFTDLERRQVESDGDADRRRYAYDCLQRVVEWDGPDEPLPSAQRSVVVRCHDISMQGVSFFWPDEPEFKHLLISLGRDDEMVFMAAKVVHSKPVYMHGAWTFMVSCRFTKRMREFTEQWKQQACSSGEALVTASESSA